MKKRILIYLLLLNCINSVGQKVEPLKIGDEVPDLNFTMLSPDGKKSIAKLSDYKRKLVILDFWATWCGSCIAEFPKMDSLQKKFKGKMQILLINTIGTKDDENKIRKFYDRWLKKYPKFQLGTVVNDKVSLPYFPHVVIPHYVWIGLDGKVKAITSAEHITGNNISRALANEELMVPQKKEFADNKQLYIGEEESIDLRDYENVSLFKKGKIEGLGEISHGRSIKSRDCGRSMNRGFAFLNMPILDIYIKTLFGFGNIDLTHKNRMIIDVSKPDLLEKGIGWYQKKTGEEREVWEKENLYTYDIIIPEAEVKADKLALPKQMLTDLNRYSPYIGTIEKRNIKCLVLVRTTAEDKIKTKGGKSQYAIYKGQQNVAMSNERLKRLAEDLNRFEWITMPVLDETNYKDKVDMSFGKYPENIIELRKELQKYDLDLIEAEREIEMFVIRDKVPTVAKEKQEIDSCLAMTK